MAIKLPRLRREIAIVETSNTPTLTFQQWIDIAFKQIEKSVTNIETVLELVGIALDQAGQALTVAFRTVNASGPVLENDYILLADATTGNIVLDLPPAATNSGALVTVKKLDSSVNTVTVEGNGAETVEGVANKVLTAQYETLRIMCDGTSWWII